MIADRIRSARLMTGLTLAELGQRLGLSHTAVQKFEKGLLTPSSAQLLSISKACSVRVEYFFRDPCVCVGEPVFHLHSPGGKKTLQILQLEMQEAAERWETLLSFFPSSPLKAFETPNILPKAVGSLEEIERLTVALRHHWNLGTGPIGNLIEAFESLGLLVIVSEKMPKGCPSACADVQSPRGKFPIFAVNARLSQPQACIALLKELGYLVLPDRLSENLDTDQACGRFAAAFLVPKEKAQFLLGEKRSRISHSELSQLEAMYGLPADDWLSRAVQCDVMDASALANIRRRLSRPDQIENDQPAPCYPRQTSSFDRLVLRAVSEGLISESKGTELLRRSLFDERANPHEGK